MIHDRDLTAGGPWVRRLEDTVYGVFALHTPGNELLIASTTYDSDLTVEFHDLDSFALKRTFVWPDSQRTAYGRVDSVAISPDGQHLAAVFSGLSPEFVEIVNVGTKQVVFSGGLGMQGSDMIWATDDLLFFAAEFEHPDFAGGIVAVSLEQLAGDSAGIDLNVLVGFSPDEWATGKPFDFVFAHDFSQMAYVWLGDIWVRDLGPSPSSPRQLTTGPGGLVGPVFSPEGEYIAFVEYERYGLSDTYVMANHRSEPWFVSGMNPELTEAYLLEANTLVERMLVWSDR